MPASKWSYTVVDCSNRVILTSELVRRERFFGWRMLRYWGFGAQWDLKESFVQINVFCWKNRFFEVQWAFGCINNLAWKNDERQPRQRKITCFFRSGQVKVLVSRRPKMWFSSLGRQLNGGSVPQQLCMYAVMDWFGLGRSFYYGSG